MIGKKITLLALLLSLLLALSSFAGGKQLSTPPTLPPPELPGLEEIPVWQARLELARLLGSSKRYPEALAEYEKVLKAKPEMAAVRLEMAKILAWTGETDQALAIFQGMETKGLDDESRLALADIYMIRKEYAQAETLYREFLVHHPEDQAVRLRLADLLTWAKQYEDAIDEFKKILAVRPNDAQVRRRYGRVLGWAGQREEAIVNLRISLGE